MRQKIADVARPKPARAAAETPPQPIIQNRSMIDDTTETTADTLPEAEANPQPQRSKRIVVTPLSSQEDPQPDKASTKKIQEDQSQPPEAPDPSDAPLPASNEPVKSEGAATEPSPETRKALEEAARREKELQEYISSRKFFVPVNTVAHERSIKISFGMTFVIFLLGIVLIDLMLDSGAIILLQKIPHTNFFDV